jgi:hypothetical protein
LAENKPEAEVAEEQAELRKRAAESVAEEQARRAAAAAAVPPAAPRGTDTRKWQPPREISGQDDSPLWMGLRILIFVALVAGGYFLFRQATYVLFAPELQALGAVVPSGPVSTDDSVTVGVHVANTSGSKGAAFVVMALTTGEEVEGETVEVPEHDTVFAPVKLKLPAGEHVFTLVAFNSWRGVRRLETYQGLSLVAASREVDVSDVQVPEHVTIGQTAEIVITVRNSGPARESILAIASLRPAAGAPILLKGAPSFVAAGATGTLRVSVDTRAVPAGSYFVEVSVETSAGEMIGRSRYPLPLEIRR